jgi:hypothetical protein
MDEKQALEDLGYIKKIIEDSRRTIIYSGKEFIFWGILASFGMLMTYVLDILHIYFYIFWFWIFIVAIGWIYSFYLSFNKRKRPHKTTFANKVLGSVWLANGIAMSIIGFIGTYSKGINPEYLNAIFASLLGTSYFISGIIVDYKTFIYLSFCWFLGSIVMFFFPGLHTFLIMAGMMIFFQILPGIGIYKKYKKELTANS